MPGFDSSRRIKIRVSTTKEKCLLAQSFCISCRFFPVITIRKLTTQVFQQESLMFTYKLYTFSGCRGQMTYFYVKFTTDLLNLGHRAKNSLSMCLISVCDNYFSCPSTGTHWGYFLWLKINLFLDKKKTKTLQLSFPRDVSV